MILKKIFKRRIFKNYPGLRWDSIKNAGDDCYLYQQDNAKIHVANNIKGVQPQSYILDIPACRTEGAEQEYINVSP